jgi:hypothetical protein
VQDRSPAWVPLLPKLRGHFAEFLDHSSPERLGILYLTTCVGLGYGPTRPSLEAFLDSIGSATSPLRAPHHLSAFMAHGFTCTPAYRFGPGQPPPGTACLPASPHRSPTTRSDHRPYPPPTRRRIMVQTGLVSRGSALAVRVGYGNINPLSIDYACRPRLRSRLTLGGTAWPRNPWSSGATDSHGGFATHACILTRAPSTTPSRGRFTRCTTLPYPTPHLAATSRRRRALWH